MSDKRILLLLLATLSASPALAKQEMLFSGVWVSDAQFCPLMEEIGTRAIFGNDIAIITMEQGFIGYEFYCDFNELEYGPDGKSVKIESFCGSSGEGYDDITYLNMHDGDIADDQMRFEFNSLFITGREGPEPGDEESRYLFTRCDDLSEQLLIERTEP